MEVLIKRDVVAPMRIFLEFLGAAIYGTLPARVTKKDPGQSPAEFLSHLKQVQVFPGSGRTFHFEIRAIERVHQQYAPNEQRVDRHPNWSAPVRVTAEHAGVRLRGQILNLVFLSMKVKHERMILVIFRQRPNPKRTEEFVFIKNIGQNAL